MPRAILYTRFSPRRNADQSESIETQLDYCRAYCTEHEYEIAGEFQDRAASGADEDRPGLWDAIAALRRTDRLVVYKLDRLSRSLYLDEYIRRKVALSGATIEAVTGTTGATDDSDEAVMLRQMLSVFAEYERKVIAARTRAAMRWHQKNGRIMSSRLPYGYRPDPDSPKTSTGHPSIMIEDESEQLIIRSIIELKAEGLGLRAIAARLNKFKVATRGGGPWRHALVKRILDRAE